MAGMTVTQKQQWLKSFPPLQQRALTGAMQSFLSAYKLSANSITSNAVLAAEPELIIPMVQAGVPYSISLLLNLTGMAAAGNVQFDFGASTATVQMLNMPVQFYTAAGVQTNGAVITTLTTVSNGGTAVINVSGTASGTVVFSNPGSFAMRVAQQGSSGTATVIDVGSSLLLESVIGSITL